jgi:hypothetical protein
MRAGGDFGPGIEMLRYWYATINYAGKIHRVEDQVTLNAFLSDLFDQDMIEATE